MDGETNQERNAQLVGHNLVVVRYGYLQLIQAWCRWVFAQMLDITQDSDFLAHITATPLEVEAFNKGESGPDDQDLHFDMLGERLSDWNIRVIHILAENFEKARLHGNPTLPKRSESYVVTMMTERWSRCRDRWNELKPRAIPGGGFENSTQIHDRLQQNQGTIAEATRHNTRRHQVRACLCSHISMCNPTLSVSTGERQSLQTFWTN